MRIGVFDIGTRATRLLIGDTRDLNFRKNFGTLTRMGEAADQHQKIRLEAMGGTLDALKEFLKEGQRHDVELYVAVGTAALRRAKNAEEIAAWLREKTGLEITILREEEEAYLSLFSSFVHFQAELERGLPILLIDQGGGSTEISCGEMRGNDFHFWGFASLELGSVLLKQTFLSDPRARISDAYRKTMSHIEREINKHKLFSELRDRPPVRAFGMGSAITNITGVRGNSRQHGRVITGERMQFMVDSCIKHYENNHHSIETLQPESNTPERLDEFERDLLILYGLPVYQSILRLYHLDRLTVCGYGLRYGVFLYLALQGPGLREIPLLRTAIGDILV